MDGKIGSGRTWVKTLRKPQFWFGAAWLVPTVLWYGAFSLGPVVRAFPLALLEYNLINPSKSIFVGLDNFRIVIRDPFFVIAVVNTFTWAVLGFVMLLPLALFLSIVLSRLKRGRNVYQALAYLPVVVSLVAVSLLFRILLDPNTGIINGLFSQFGLPTSKWLTDSSSALPTAVAISVWKGIGFHIVVLTAGLLSIPEEYYEAAMVDGANEWQRFWKITLPLLSNTLLLIMVLLAIGTLQEFTLPYVLTGGGPGTATLMYNMQIYNEAFQNLRFGTASALALLQFAVILTISYLQIRLLRPRWSY